MNSAYYQHICSGTAHAISRQNRANEVLQSTELLIDLTQFASNLANPHLHKALWIIELVALKKPSLRSWPFEFYISSVLNIHG